MRSAIAGSARRWPGWCGYAACAWALAFSVLALSWALGSKTGYVLGDTGMAETAAWGITVAYSAAAMVALATVRPFGQGIPHRAILAITWGACVLSGAGTFGFIMSAVQLIFSARVDDWAIITTETLCTVGAVLFAGTALSFSRRSRTSCARCGRPHAVGRMTGPHSPPAPAPPAVRWAAYAGAAAFLPYAAMKTIWALGGSFAGASGAEMETVYRKNGASGLMLTLIEYGLDPTVIMAAVGVLLLLALVRPWGQTFPWLIPALAGRRVPRWLPLTPAWLGAATLAPYGVFGIGYLTLAAFGMTSIPRTPDDYVFSESGRVLVAWVGLGGFGVFGVALLVAAWSYQRRTRPVCAGGHAEQRPAPLAT